MNQGRRREGRKRIEGHRLFDQKKGKGRRRNEKDGFSESRYLVEGKAEGRKATGLAREEHGNGERKREMREKVQGSKWEEERANKNGGGGRKKVGRE